MSKPILQPFARSAARRLAAVLFLLLLVAGRPLRAGTGTWTAIGPEGASVRIFAISPAGGTVYAGTGDGGVFKSRDGGTTWIPARRGLTASLVYRLVLVPGSTDVLYAGTYSGVFKSVDGARSWHQTDFQAPVADVEVAPSDPHILYLTDLYNVYRSIDAGTHWTQVSNSTFFVYANFLAVDPRDPETVFASGERGVLKSTDGGHTWETLLSLSAGKVLLDPFDPETIYIPTTEGLERSTDGGAHWSPINAGLPLDLTAYTVDPSSPGTLYATAARDVGYGIYRSTDHGESWTLVVSQEGVSAVAVDPREPNLLYGGLDEAGVFRSRDGGARWSSSRRGLVATGSTELRTASDGTLYALTQTHPYASSTSRVWVTRDHGVSWTARTLFGTDVAPGKLLLDPTSPATLYLGYGSFDLIYKSADGGVSFRPAASGLLNPTTTSVSDLALSSAAPSTLFALTANVTNSAPATLYRSDDGGGGWLPLSWPLGANPRVLAVDPVKPQIVYIAGAALYKSSDRGSTWRRFGHGVSSPWTYLAIAPRSPSTLYGVTRTPQGSLLVKSLDSGATWAAAASGLPAGAEIRDLAFDPHRPNTLYAATAAGVFVTDNGGKRWTALNQGLLDLSVVSVAVDTEDPRTVYAGTSGLGGLFVLTRE